MLLALGGCKEDEKHPEASRAPEPVASASPSASVERPGSPDAEARLPPLPPLPAASHAYQHGVWSSCANGYGVSGQPRPDVTRLAFLCGPYQGMSRHGRTWFGRLEPGKHASFERTLQKDQCARVFAVAEEPDSVFRVSVSSPSGEVVARNRSHDGFIVVNEQGAFCVGETGSFSIRVEGERGSGRAAVEVWSLPPP